LKLELIVSKVLRSKYRPRGLYYVFSVVDLDRAKTYPQNFICVLPKSINVRSKNQNRFVELFSKNSLILAKDLLNNLLKSNKNIEIEREIKQRLRLLDSKSVLTFKCHNCGSLFEPYEPEYKYQNICLKCI
jgi:hypothetical protein